MWKDFLTYATLLALCLTAYVEGFSPVAWFAIAVLLFLATLREVEME